MQNDQLCFEIRTNIRYTLWAYLSDRLRGYGDTMDGLWINVHREVNATINNVAQAIRGSTPTKMDTYRQTNHPEEVAQLFIGW